MPKSTLRADSPDPRERRAATRAQNRRALNTLTWEERQGYVTRPNPAGAPMVGSSVPRPTARLDWDSAPTSRRPAELQAHDRFLASERAYVANAQVGLSKTWDPDLGRYLGKNPKR